MRDASSETFDNDDYNIDITSPSGTMWLIIAFCKRVLCGRMLDCSIVSNGE